jgi:hypothetical protein
VTVSGNTVSVTVTSGIGPQGPAGGGTSAAGVSSLNALTGTLTIESAAGVTASGTKITIGAGSGSSAWGDITGKPDLVNSVAGRTGTVTLTTADLSDFATEAAKYGPVTSVAGRTGAITLAAADVSGLATVATSGKYTDLSGAPSLAAIATSGSAGDLTSGTVPTARLSVATTTAVGVVSSSSGLSITAAGALSADVRSVAGRTGAITLSTADVSGNLVASVNGLTGTVTIAAGANVTISTSASTITVAAAAGSGGSTDPHPFIFSGI